MALSKDENENYSNSLLKEYEKIESLLSQPNKPEPVSVNAKNVAIEAYDHLRCHHYIAEADLLVGLLANPHIKSLLLCHDTVANKAYSPKLPPIPHEVDEDDVSIKIVTLIKQNEPLGATIKINERNGAVLVARVMHGGAADRSGPNFTILNLEQGKTAVQKLNSATRTIIIAHRAVFLTSHLKQESTQLIPKDIRALEAGDEIQEINGVGVRGRDPMEIVRMLTTISGDVKLKLSPSSVVRPPSGQNQVHVRALFSYSPSSDPLIPCPEAGLSFLKGEILRLANVDDPNWWQAIKVEFAPSVPVPSVLNATQPGLGRVGLIPSKTLKEWRNQYRKGPSNAADGQDTHVSDSLSYEEVEIYFPEEGCYRPLVLVGPAGVGKSELVHQLIKTDPDHFREPIRITTREPLPGEVHGIDYLFVTRDEFNTFVEADSLIDQSVNSRGEMTGLCLEAVLEITQAGQVAVLEMDYHNLMQIRSATLKPFIIFVKPPTLDVLLETRQILRNPDDEFTSSTESLRCGANDSPSAVRSVPSTPKMTSQSRSSRMLGLLTPVRHKQSMTKQADEAMNLADRSIRAREQSNDSFSRRKLTEENLHEMLRVAARLEVTHGHLWDYVLINDDLPVALEQLSELAYRLETEAFWVPSQWITNTGAETSGSAQTTSEGNINVSASRVIENSQVSH